MNTGTRVKAGLVVVAIAACAALVLSMAGREPPIEDGPLFGAPPPGGIILAWNNAYPEGSETARWYAQSVGFTDALMVHADAAAVNVPYLSSGIRVTAARPVWSHDYEADPPGATYLIKERRRVSNPYAKAAIKALRVDKRKRFPDSLTPEVRANVRFVLVDSENIPAPPSTMVEDPGQGEAIAIVERAARAAGVLREGESMPPLYYGISDERPELFDADGALKTDSPTYRFLDWWYARGGGEGHLWFAALKPIRKRFPHAYLTSDPICGTESRYPVPVFGAKAAGLDFVMNWFNITGRGDRTPIFAAVELKLAKASGLPVVQGPQLFPTLDEPLAYSHDLLLTSNLLTLAFNPRNGASDPDVPWGITHWGMRQLTEGMTEETLAAQHDDAAQALFKNLERNQRRVVPAVRETRRFLDENNELLREARDLPADVGIVLTHGSAYVARGFEWWDHQYRITEYPTALLMAHIPFEFVDEAADLSRFRVLVVPHTSYVGDQLVRRLADFKGTVTGSGVPEKVRAKVPGWVDPPSVEEVGAWPWGDQRGYPLGGHLKKIDAAKARAWMLDRAVRLGGFFTGLGCPPIVDTDPETLVNVLRWRDRRVVIAVNHRMRSAGDPARAERCAPHRTEIVVGGNWKGGRYEPERSATVFPVSFEGAGARVIVLEPDDRAAGAAGSS